MKNFFLLAVAFLTASGADARNSDDYDVMDWQELGTFSIREGQLLEIDAGGLEGQFVRVKSPDSCGRVGLGVQAEGTPITPRMIYDRNAWVRTPAMQRLHWYVGQERDIAFAQIWLSPSEVETGTCDVTVEIAKGAPTTPIDPTTPTVLAEGSAQSDISEEVVVDLAWNRTIARAQTLCRTLNVAKVPGRGTCTAQARGNHWSAQCQAWFYCLPEN